MISQMMLSVAEGHAECAALLIISAMEPAAFSTAKVALAGSLLRAVSRT